jgi:hypothetical protein
MTDSFKDNIDKQLDFNKGKNLFHDHSPQSLRFLQDTIDQIYNFKGIPGDQEELLIDYTTDKVLEEFCRVNQYISFDQKDKENLRAIYAALFKDIKNHESEVDALAITHYGRLKAWFEISNPSFETIYKNESLIIDPVACSEYSAELQLEILQIDYTSLMEPILDIGCGKEAKLVRFLRSKGLEAYGFDRLAVDESFIHRNDWLESDYVPGKWGTIISNLGFSNHFHHHHLRTDGNFLGYAQKYMEILNSLMVGGQFHYAPGLPFIEQYLSAEKYRLTTYSLNNNTFTSSVIMKINQQL